MDQRTRNGKYSKQHKEQCKWAEKDEELRLILRRIWVRNPFAIEKKIPVCCTMNGDQHKRKGWKSNDDIQCNTRLSMRRTGKLILCVKCFLMFFNELILMQLNNFSHISILPLEVFIYPWKSFWTVNLVRDLEIKQR